MFYDLYGVYKSSPKSYSFFVYTLYKLAKYQCPEHKELTENLLRKSSTVLSIYHMHTACVCIPFKNLNIQCNTVNPTTVITTTRMIRHFFFGPFKTPISPMYFYHG